MLLATFCFLFSNKALAHIYYLLTPTFFRELGAWGKKAREQGAWKRNGSNLSQLEFGNVTIDHDKSPSSWERNVEGSREHRPALP